jgi:hypothetical protein
MGDFHSGSACLKVKGRHLASDGPHQDIMKKISEGTTYQMEAWVKLKDSTEDARLRIWLRSDAGWQYIDAGAALAVAGGWTYVAGSLTPTWFGTLYEAWWKVETESDHKDFWVDDAVLVEDSAASEIEIIPIPGTWRRDVIAP